LWVNTMNQPISPAPLHVLLEREAWRWLLRCLVALVANVLLHVAALSLLQTLPPGAQTLALGLALLTATLYAGTMFGLAYPVLSQAAMPRYVLWSVLAAFALEFGALILAQRWATLEPTAQWLSVAGVLCGGLMLGLVQWRMFSRRGSTSGLWVLSTWLGWGVAMTAHLSSILSR
jgi:hypothetical protein